MPAILGHVMGESRAKVWRLLATGLPNKLIAEEIGLAENTVKIHIHDLMKQLGCDNRTQVALAFHAIPWRRR